MPVGDSRKQPDTSIAQTHTSIAQGHRLDGSTGQGVHLQMKGGGQHVEEKTLQVLFQAGFPTVSPSSANSP